MTLPTAAPYVFTGLRIASSLAVISALIAEYFGGPVGGLGKAITSAAASSNYPLAWAYVLGAIVLGLVFYVAALAVWRCGRTPAPRPELQAGQIHQEKEKSMKRRPGAGRRRAASAALLGAGRLRRRRAVSRSPSASASAAEELTKVKLQLQWVAQAQFAGYYAAVEQGYYEEEGLDVEIVEGGVDIVPQDVLSAGDVDYAISWVPKVLGSIEQGAKITDVAQIFERSATTQISFKDKNITDPAAPQGQEGRQLGLRQRVGAVRRDAEERSRTSATSS